MVKIENIEQALKCENNFSKYSDVKSILVRGSRVNFSPKLCVVVPTFKRPSTLKMTIDSILNQEKFSDFLLIICDNNPERNDETEKYINTVTDPRVKYYKNAENIGLFGNWNRIFELSETELTVIIHDDDYMFPNYLNVVYNIMSNDNAVDALYAKPYQWNENDEMPPNPVLYKKNHYTKLTDADLFGNPFAPTGLIIKKSKMIELGGFNPDLYPASDYFFNVNAVDKINVYYTEEKLYVYRWSVNAYTKLETLLQYPKFDIQIWKYICRKIGFPKLFTDLMMFKQKTYFLETVKMYHPDYEIKNMQKDMNYHKNIALLFFGKIFMLFWVIYRKFTQYRNRTVIYVN